MRFFRKTGITVPNTQDNVMEAAKVFVAQYLRAGETKKSLEIVVKKRIGKLQKFKDELLQSCVPFWLNNGVDKE